MFSLGAFPNATQPCASVLLLVFWCGKELIGEEDGEESECNGCEDHAGCVAGVAIYLGGETGCGAVE